MRLKDLSADRRVEPLRFPAAQPPKAGRLHSWKEIAAHLKHSVRTVQRWESEGLPIRRHPHEKRDSVYAYPEELDAWWEKHHSLDSGQHPFPIRKAGTP